MADGGRDGANLKMTAILVVAVSLMIALSGYAVILMMEKLNADDQEYKKSWNYTTSGTRTVDSSSYKFEGTGESKYVFETDDYRTYDFTFTQSDSCGEFTVKAKLLCDSGGTPTDIYDKDGEEDGTSYWRYEESGTEYRFGINGERVVSVDIKTADLNLEARII